MLVVFPKTLSAGILFPVMLLIIFSISGAISGWMQVHEFNLIGCCAAFVTSFGLQISFFRHVYLAIIHNISLSQ
jgi:hypothetical protein